jgi:Mg2+ and Co2+ transporter CorA
MCFLNCLGVYGTNFEKLPEISWEYGYLYFWALILFSVALTVSLLRYKRII